MKKYAMHIATAILVVALATLIWWVKAHKPTVVNDQNIITMSGLHAHPELTIYVKGEKIDIPHGLGMGAMEMPIHTHEDLPLIHLEFPGKVTTDDIRLGKFFAVWGKGFKDFGQTVSMTVNGTPNTEYENYVMRDGDKIELHYE